jgi:hypothetical protein
LEKQVLSLHADGKGKSRPLLEKSAGLEVQKMARELGLRRLSPKQEAAAALILSSADRFVGVQGVRRWQIDHAAAGGTDCGGAGAQSDRVGSRHGNRSPIGR